MLQELTRLGLAFGIQILTIYFWYYIISNTGEF